jgi:hypothetical protein
MVTVVMTTEEQWVVNVVTNVSVPSGSKLCPKVGMSVKVGIRRSTADRC